MFAYIFNINIMIIEFDRLDGNTLHLTCKLETCKGCGMKMLPHYNGLSLHVSKMLYDQGIRRACYSESNLCDDCLKVGGYKRRCSLCDREYIFPQEFAFKFSEYPKYPEGETEYTFVCQVCAKERAVEVLGIAIKADDTEDMRK